jgi:hypothetical protein
VPSLRIDGYYVKSTKRVGLWLIAILTKGRKEEVRESKIRG